jgi:hypothetical protein
VTEGRTEGRTEAEVEANTGNDALTNAPAHSRYEALTALTARYRELASENYDRVRGVAEAIRSGFCGYLGSDNPPCVLLVPPVGPFEPRAYGDFAFSVPPSGFQPLGPIAFGLAVRVSRQNDWTRLVLECAKEADHFTITIFGGGQSSVRLSVNERNPAEFFAALYAHVLGFFDRAIDDYQHGRYGQRDIGFDFALAPPKLTAQSEPI